MRVIFSFLFILGICVVYLSQNVGGIRKKEKKPLQHLVTTTTLPTTTQTEAFEDFDEKIDGGHCHKEFLLCEKDLYYDAKPICVYKKAVGLTNFFGLCTVKMQYCLMAHQKKGQDISPFSPEDAYEIYHNGQHFDCLYYGQRVKTEKEAIIWYFKLGGLDAQTQEITKPFQIHIVYK